MKVLVTGGCGYVGTKLALALLTRTEHEVTLFNTEWFGNYLSPPTATPALASDRLRPPDRCRPAIIRPQKALIPNGTPMKKERRKKREKKTPKKKQ